VINLDLRKDENRHSLTSSTAAEERQDVSSKNTTDEMSDPINGGNNVCFCALWPANIPEKSGNIGWNMKQVLFDIVMKSHFLNMVFTIRKRHKLMTEINRICLIRRQNPNGEVIDRSWYCFLLHKLELNISFIDWCALIRLNVLLC